MTKTAKIGIAGGALAALLVVNTLWLGLGANIDAQCSANGHGEASCTFANLGWMPAQRCVSVVFYSGPGKLPSVPLCSGLLWPMSGSTAEAKRAFNHSPAEWCTDGNRDRDWRKTCMMTVEKPMQRY